MSVQFIYDDGAAAGGASGAAGTAGESSAVDVMVVFVTKEELKQPSAAGSGWVHPQLDEALRQHAAKELFKSEPKETLALPTLGLLPESHVLFVGIPAKDRLTTDSLRDAAAVAAKAVARLKAAAVKQLIPAARRQLRRKRSRA
ncbi:leucyl aminopeptidase [Paenibacillus taihuensis]|uniref:Leucyl aminopeptidase n=1 Tax=Paenibacillus taihuensis TaxID=1156355 RepID=A0A3D9RYW0_9BACL|nr:M17 family peptidase N-terminal domain-containing protein [Paenibacillus taihuensis]REE85179.1 leucyl aminopeptidase [Paenibacillus taihuensis]